MALTGTSFMAFEPGDEPLPIEEVDEDTSEDEDTDDDVDTED